MPKTQPNPNNQNPKRKYDLCERTTTFSQEIINFCKSVPQSPINNPMVSQLVRSGTSIGANYSEADEANSKKDYINKVAIAKKETKETKYWLQLIGQSIETLRPKARELWKEAQELNLILASIIRSCNSKKKEFEV